MTPAEVHALSAHLKSSVATMARKCRVDQTIWNAHAGYCLEATATLERALPKYLMVCTALAELLDAFEMSADDMDVYEYDTIADAAKAGARRALKMASSPSR